MPLPLALHLDRTDARPLGVQIADQVRSLVLAGTLGPGTRLPSSRRLAADLGVSRSVVEHAWDQLRAEGWLEARTGSGSWVGSGSGAAPAARPGSVPMARPPARRPAEEPPLRSLGAGTPWVDPRHDAAWRRAWREVATARPPLDYQDPRGLPELRELLAERISRTRGLDVGPEDVRVVAGTTAGLRHLLEAMPPGPVAVEDPGYRTAVAVARAGGREVRDLPTTTAVSDLDGVRAAYVTPAHQHPLGTVMPAERRLALLAAARRARAWVIEDDYDSEFRYDVAPVPALSALDPTRVAYLGTASKSVLPSLRLGWMVVPDELRETVDDHRLLTHDAASWPVQRAFWALLRDGYVDAVVRSARRVYAERAPRVVDALSPHAVLAAPVAGMYSTWLLPHDRAVRARDAARTAGFHLNLLADYCRTSPLTGLVVGFGGVTDEELAAALRVIVRALA